MKNVKKKWKTLGIRGKGYLGILAIMGSLILFMGSSLLVFNMYLSDFGGILDQQNQTQELEDAYEEESTSFRLYANQRTQKNGQAYEQHRNTVEQLAGQLPDQYPQMDRERYLASRAFRNVYFNYHKECDVFFSLSEESQIYIHQLYKCYAMETYLENYIQRLQSATLEVGIQSYQKDLSSIKRIPLIWTIVVFIVLLLVFLTIRYTLSITIKPILLMSRDAREIAQNHFDIPDLPVAYDDEVGELTNAFNQMKHATAASITRLQEKNELEHRYHAEELQRMEAEHMLNVMQMRMLQNQINPHFLFNTLNIISGMARIEDAKNTNEMIQRLGNLFRYNIRTDSELVEFSSERKVAEDYFYIQKRRFGSRIQQQWDVRVDENLTMIPAFTLQPLIENAVIHGIGPKEEGGMIRVRVLQKKEQIILYVIDSGVGIPGKKLEQIRRELEIGEGEHMGIGMVNVCKRYRMLFPNSYFRIFSREGIGTMVKIRWDSQRKEKQRKDVEDTHCR